MTAKEVDSEIASPACIAEALFIDSLDPFRHLDGDEDWDGEFGPDALRKVLHNLKNQPRLSFIILEDFDTIPDATVRRHTSDCEQMADILIELRASDNNGYQLNELRIHKRHFGHHIRGWHEYKVLPPNHPLSNIDTVTGFITYPSLHYYLSTSRCDTYSRKSDFVHTGIAHLDSILDSERVPAPIADVPFPRTHVSLFRGTGRPTMFRLR